MNHQEIILKEVMAEHEVDVSDCQIIEIVRSLKHIWEPEPQVSASLAKEYIGLGACWATMLDHMGGGELKKRFEVSAQLTGFLENLIDKNR